MKVLVENYTGSARIFLDLPAIPQKGEYLMFSTLEGDKDLSAEEEILAENSTRFLLDDEENEDHANPGYIVMSRTFHNNGFVEIRVRAEELVETDK